MLDNDQLRYELISRMSSALAIEVVASKTD